MLKSLTFRAIVPVAIAITGFVVVCCILLYSALKADMINDAVSYETKLADTIIRSTHYAMLKGDRETLRNIIENISSQDELEHVRIFNKKGLIMFSGKHGEVLTYVDKKASGCIGCHAGPVAKSTLKQMERARRFQDPRGKEIIAITSPLYNDPACYTASCHFHGADQKILGILDIGISAEHLDSTLTLLQSRMIIFSIMILLLSIGGVAALLRRQVFVPLRQIRTFTSKVNSGSLSHDLSGISGELTDLACDVRSIACQLKVAEEELRKIKGSRKTDHEPVAEAGSAP
ncbi:HAMP domain-containing protein [Geotalea sp. SG265]|uniref:HAMP domain-containing protein n=1 Tax=Geotalea sp. SG265 TaxID=2922867 RepID=UPI001FAF45F5|nr:HAMP domain-containing protein [Geotalea sp. SG265]